MPREDTERRVAQALGFPTDPDYNDFRKGTPEYRRAVEVLGPLVNIDVRRITPDVVGRFEEELTAAESAWDSTETYGYATRYSTEVERAVSRYFERTRHQLQQLKTRVDSGRRQDSERSLRPYGR